MPTTKTPTIERDGYALTVPSRDTDRFGSSWALDDRSNQKYGRYVTITLKTTDPDKAPYEHETPYDVRNAAQALGRVIHADVALKEALKALFSGTAVKVHEMREGVWDRWKPVSDENPWQANVTLFIVSPRPSKTLAAEDVPARLGEMSGGDLGTLFDAMLTAVTGVLDARVEAGQLAKDREDAAKMLAWLADTADKRGRKAVRWKQRLAALKAELEAEQDEQIEDMIAPGGKFDEAVAKAAEDGEGFSPRAVEAARKAAREKRARTEPLTRFMGTGERKVTFDEITSIALD